MDEGDDDDFGFNNPASGALFELEARNRLANRSIEKFTSKHRKQDGWLALGGFVPIPGAGLAAMIAALALQAPRIYKPMAHEMAAIYLATPEELSEIEQNTVRPGLKINARLDVAAELTTELMQLLIGDIIGELLFGGLLATIPFFGGFVGLAFDLRIATKMTRRTGLMMSIYYQNQGRWTEGGREATYNVAKNMQGDADDVRRESAEVRLGWVKRAKYIMETLMQMPGATKEKVRNIMIERNVPPDIVDEALNSI